MKRQVSVAACVVLLWALWGTAAADELAEVKANYEATLAASGAVSFSYAGELEKGSTKTQFAGSATYSSEFFIKADSTISKGGAASRHLVRCDGSTLWEVVESGGNPTYVGKADMVLLRKTYGKAFSLFSVDHNPCLQVSLMGSIPLLTKMYDLKYETTYAVDSKETLAFVGVVNRDALQRSISRGVNRMSSSLSSLQRTAEKIWFYFGKDDGLLYRMQAVSGGRGPYLTITFKDYQVMESADDLAVGYAPPSGAKVTDLVEDMMEGIEEYRTRMARIPLREGEVVDAVTLRTMGKVALPMESFSDAVLVLVWDNMVGGGSPVTDEDLQRLSSVVGQMVGKQIYVIALTNRSGSQKTLLEGRSPFAFPIVWAPNVEKNETVTALRLLDVPSRALVLEPGLKVRAVIPCNNAKWVDHTRKAAAEALAEKKG